MKRVSIALILILTVIPVAGMACNGNENIEPTPTPTPTPNTPEATLSEPEKTVWTACHAINNNDCYSQASCYAPELYDMITNPINCEFLKTITCDNHQTSLVSINGDSAVVHSEYDSSSSDGTTQHFLQYVELERMGTKWIMTGTTNVD